MLLIVLQALYFFLPAYVANMAPVFAHALHLPGEQPISARYFGEHKTVRGFVAGVVAALAVLFLQKVLYETGYTFVQDISLLNYSAISMLLYGFAFGAGAIGGDVLKSFFKRRLGRAPGTPWVPFDQLDFVLGALVCVYPLYQLGLQFIVVLVVVTPFLHVLTNFVGYYLKLKQVWW